MHISFNKILDYGLSFPKTVYFNFRMFPWRIAIRLPVLVSRRVWLESLHGKIHLSKDVGLGDVRIGFGRVGIFDYHRERTILQVDGEIFFRGKGSLGQGTRISVGEKGKLVFGRNINITAETAIICHNKIEFGDDCIISWNCQFMDIDFHYIVREGNLLNPTQPIKIGNHCWICSRCLILKGTNLKDNCILGGGQYIYRCTT